MFFNNIQIMSVDIIGLLYTVNMTGNKTEFKTSGAPTWCGISRCTPKGWSWFVAKPWRCIGGGGTEGRCTRGPGTHSTPKGAVGGCVGTATTKHRPLGGRGCSEPLWLGGGRRSKGGVGGLSTKGCGIDRGGAATTKGVAVGAGCGGCGAEREA